MENKKKLTLVLKVENNGEVIVEDKLSTRTNIRFLLDLVYETYKWWLVKKAAINNIKDKLSIFIPAKKTKPLSDEKLVITAKILEDGEEVMENILTTNKPGKAIGLIMSLMASI